MNETIPKWAQPFGGEKACSICRSKDIYFQVLDGVEGEVELKDGTVIACWDFFLKIWCKECFEEYGGNV